jgi:hypothetical protein
LSRNLPNCFIFLSSVSFLSRTLPPCTLHDARKSPRPFWAHFYCTSKWTSYRAYSFVNPGLNLEWPNLEWPKLERLNVEWPNLEWPNLEWPNLELDRTSNDWSSKVTEPRMTEPWKGPNLE